MTEAEFEAGYAARSGVSVEWLHKRGRFAEPCDCGEPYCEGWAMGNQWEDAIAENELRAVPQKADLRPGAPFPGFNDWHIPYWRSPQ